SARPAPRRPADRPAACRLAGCLWGVSTARRAARRSPRGTAPVDPPGRRLVVDSRRGRHYRVRSVARLAGVRPAVHPAVLVRPVSGRRFSWPGPRGRRLGPDPAARLRPGADLDVQPAWGFRRPAAVRALAIPVVGRLGPPARHPGRPGFALV